jgi:hypothetical protein
LVVNSVHSLVQVLPLYILLCLILQSAESLYSCGLYFLFYFFKINISPLHICVQ